VIADAVRVADPVSDTPHNRAVSSTLDLSRWLAAWVVLFDHARNHLFPDYKLVAAPNAAMKAFFFAAATGNAAVMVFFILSGYLVGGALYRSPRTLDALIRYTAARLSRLLIVVIPALGLTYALGGLRWMLSHGTDGVLLTEQFAGRVLVANALFLQTVTAPIFGDNYPTWSLANEFWYYAACPLLVFVPALRRRSPGLALLAVTALAALLLFVGQSIASYFVIWLVGMGVSALGLKTSSRWLAPATVLFVVAVSISRLRYAGGWFPFDLAVGLVFAWVLTAVRDPLWSPRWILVLARSNAVLAGFSFTLYTIHAPLLQFVNARLVRSPLDAHQAQSWIQYLIVCGSIGAIAFLVAQVTERNTYALRSRLERAMR
jgi:peptidoglycan/LPS O-acetylase OafA/YrhL